jgi:hypothetical protein
MEFLVLAILLGLIPAVIARRKGHDFVLWWVLGAALLVVALPVAIIMKPDPATRRPCPMCRTSIDAQARVCPQCGRDVAEQSAPL